MNRKVQSHKVQSPKPSGALMLALRQFGPWTLVIGTLVLAACQTERVTTSDGWRLPPEPRATPVPPSSLRADRMLFSVGSKPDDTNNNGFPDSIVVSVSLFSHQHPTALMQDGTFIFTMYRQGDFSMPDAKPMATWRMPPEKVKQSVAQAMVGPCYLFQLSLLEMGSDRLPLERADLVCRFEPSDAEASPVQSDGVRTIQIGRRMNAQN